MKINGCMIIILHVYRMGMLNLKMVFPGNGLFSQVALGM